MENFFYNDEYYRNVYHLAKSLNINKSNVNDLDVRTIIDRVVTLNAEKLTKRLKNNTIHGDGDYR